ncbi:MAG: S8 family peptidase [Chitinophagaceae bacterium]|nr:S8 family peptidase [Chitinophagaceae bacterium]
MKKILLLCLILNVFLSELSQAAPAYAFRVKFKDKNGTLTFADSLQFLSQKALTRRSNQGIMLDSTDLPLVQAYIDTVMTTAAAVKLHNKSKWFNQIVVITFDSNKVTDIAALPMVESVKLVARYPTGNFKTETSSKKFPVVEPITDKKTRGTAAHYGVAFQQIDLMQGDYLHDMGFKGENMDIAVIDVNFRYANTCAVYDSINLQNRFKDYHNFVKDTPWVFSTSINNDHGMNVMGCMGANMPGTYVGTAPNANFFLYITEDIGSEQPIEEDNWISAAERADSIGVYLINSSLGYNIFDAPHSASSYTYNDMDGKTALITQGGSMAVAKGILVVCAQGNEGASAWHYMLAPADGDSVYSVGSVDGSGAWGNSGYGPNFLGVVKPDGMAMGKGSVLIGGSCNPGVSNGSSFASPMMCGSIACLWQSAPTLTNWEIRQIVRMSSDRYNNPNNTHGYGIPNFQQAHQIILGTDDVQQLDYRFSVYPNPSSGELYIRSFDASLQNFSYAVYDLQGHLITRSEKVVQGSVHAQAFSALASGTYVVVIAAGGKVWSTKVVKR